MAVLCKQFKSMAQSHPAPDALRQLPRLDVVHFARLTVLEDDALPAQPQPAVILLGKSAQMHGDGTQCIPGTVPPNTHSRLAS